MTIHYESVRMLCVGADFQQKIADDAQARAEIIAKQVIPLEKQLLELRKQLAESQNEALEHERLAADFRLMAAEQCEKNGWDMPEPTAIPDQPEPTGNGQDPGSQRVSEPCMVGECPCNVTGCVHDCHWIPAVQPAEAPVEQTRPDVTETPAQAVAVRAPSWLAILAVLAVYAFWSMGTSVRSTRRRHRGAHAASWRPLAHRPGALIPEEAT